MNLLQSDDILKNDENGNKKQKSNSKPNQIQCVIPFCIFELEIKQNKNQILNLNG